MLSIGVVSVIVVISTFLLWLLLVCGYALKYGIDPPAVASDEDWIRDLLPPACSGPPVCSSDSSTKGAAAEIEPTSGGREAELCSLAQQSCGNSSDAFVFEGDVATAAPAGSAERLRSPPALAVPFMMPGPDAPEPWLTGEEPFDDAVAFSHIDPPTLPVTPKLDAHRPLPAVQPKFKLSPGPGSYPQVGALAPSQITCFDFPVCMSCVSADMGAAPHEEEMPYVGTDHRSQL